MRLSERTRTGLLRFSVSLAVGIAGGAVFYELGMPLPFMLGPMLACMLASLAGLPLGTPGFVRPPMSAVIGAMIGTSFGPSTIANVATWRLPIAGLSIFLACCAVAGMFFFRVVMRYDTKTAYFSGMPGGLIDMVLLGEASGADGRKIALVHTTRIAIVTFIVPILTRWVSGAAGASATKATVSIFSVSPGFFLLFGATAIAGVGLGLLLRLPAPYFLGPMSVSAVLHMTGISDFKLPYEMVSVAQIVLGVTIGCRFVGMEARTICATFLAGFASTGMLLVITGLFAWGIGAYSDIPPLMLFLAYSPGGIAEMSMVALALNLDTALVVTHHVARIFLVGFGGPLVFQLAKGRSSRQ